MQRFVNLDWLEVYALEDFRKSPCDAQFFRERGWDVSEREYGTRVYREMFTLYDVHGEPFLEIRRNPYSTEGKDHGFFPPESCHIRLHNRTCYLPNAINLLREFMVRYNYTMKNIYRLDVCMDFERFDKGDDPAKFIERYMKGRYSKINQARISSHGTDQWNGRQWNSLAWGQPKSMVSTKFYCKTMELEQVHDKPYIWYAWMGDAEHRGLIDDPINHTRKAKDGTIYKPVIWRVEFSIKSSAKKVFVIDKTSGKKGKIEMPHTLDLYDTPLKLLTIFASLQAHYFHFKMYEENQRKDRCADKVLFEFSPKDTFYKLDRLATHKVNARPSERLLAILRNYKLVHPAPTIAKACDTLIDAIEKDLLRLQVGPSGTYEDVLLLQRLIAERIEHPECDLSEMKREIKDLFDSVKDNTIY